MKTNKSGSNNHEGHLQNDKTLVVCSTELLIHLATSHKHGFDPRSESQNQDVQKYVPSAIIICSLHIGQYWSSHIDSVFILSTFREESPKIIFPQKDLESNLEMFNAVNCRHEKTRVSLIVSRVAWLYDSFITVFHFHNNQLNAGTAPEATFQHQNATNLFSVRAPAETSTGEGLTTLTQAPKSDGEYPFKYPLSQCLRKHSKSSKIRMSRINAVMTCVLARSRRDGRTSIRSTTIKRHSEIDRVHRTRFV